MSRRTGFALLVLGPLAPIAIALGCSRTPPEPAPASTTNTASTRPAPSAPSASGAEPQARAASASRGGGADGATGQPGARCITATPAEAPPLPPPASAAACPADPDGIPKLKVLQVGFPEAPGNPKVEVELVTTEKDIQRGLMYRRTMPEDHGMLFRLEERREHTFWMHNTCLSLDMLFVDDDGMIVGIVEGATPLTDTTRTVGCPSSFVLEVNAGWTRRHGVRAGQKMGIPAGAR